MAKCRATGCNANVQEGYGMCRKHWFMVPHALRSQIWDSVGTPLNRELWADAIVKVAEREGITPLLEEDSNG